jgi:hypothetical protein
MSSVPNVSDDCESKRGTVLSNVILYSTISPTLTIWPSFASSSSIWGCERLIGVFCLENVGHCSAIVSPLLSVHFARRGPLRHTTPRDAASIAARQTCKCCINSTTNTKQWDITHCWINLSLSCDR